MERGGVSSKLLLCQVLVGKVFHCKERIDGEALREGFDSHLSPAKHQLIIFSTVHILPSYIVHFEKSDGDFRYMNEMPNSALWPRKKLKWNAALERKTWYMDQSRKSLFFHWRQTKTSLYLWISYIHVTFTDTKTESGYRVGDTCRSLHLLSRLYNPASYLCRKDGRQQSQPFLERLVSWMTTLMWRRPLMSRRTVSNFFNILKLFLIIILTNKES